MVSTADGSLLLLSRSSSTTAQPGASSNNPSDVQVCRGCSWDWPDSSEAVTLFIENAAAAQVALVSGTS